MKVTIALTQGAFYFVTGVWPLLSMRTFLMVTGPKTDLWLVKTVGALVAVVGAALFLDAIRGGVSGGIVLLGAASAAALGTVDVNYVSRGVISKVYLLDAAVEAVIALLWLTAIFVGS